MTEASKELHDQCIDEFIDAVRHNVEYWAAQDLPEREKLEGVAFSLLVMLDGCSGAFGGIIKNFHYQYSDENDDDQEAEIEIKCHLHEYFHRKDKE